MGRGISSVFLVFVVSSNVRILKLSSGDAEKNYDVFFPMTAQTPYRGSPLRGQTSYWIFLVLALPREMCDLVAGRQLGREGVRG